MILQEISQIVGAAGNIYAFQEEKILKVIRNIPTLWEVIEDQKFHEQHHAEDLEEINKHGKNLMESRHYSLRSGNFYHAYHHILYVFKRPIKKQ